MNGNNINEIERTLNSIKPSYDFGPCEAVLELIEDDISLITSGIVRLNYEAIKIAANEIGVSAEDLDNTIEFLVTINPQIIHIFNKEAADLKINVANFISYREKTRVLMKDAADETLSNGVAKKFGVLE